ALRQRGDVRGLVERSAELLLGSALRSGGLAATAVRPAAGVFGGGRRRRGEGDGHRLRRGGRGGPGRRGRRATRVASGRRGGTTGVRGGRGAGRLQDRAGAGAVAVHHGALDLSGGGSV